MLKKLKRLDLYINHGVWVFLPNNGLVKRKIHSIDVHYLNARHFLVTSLWLQGAGLFSPEDVYMTRREAFIGHIKKLQKLLDESNKELERHKSDMEMNMTYQLRQYENSLACRTRDLKRVLASEDRYLKKKGVSEEERAQIKFFRELGFERVDYERVKNGNS